MSVISLDLRPVFILDTFWNMYISNLNTIEASLMATKQFPSLWHCQIKNQRLWDYRLNIQKNIDNWQKSKAVWYFLKIVDLNCAEALVYNYGVAHCVTDIDLCRLLYFPSCSIQRSAKACNTPIWIDNNKWAKTGTCTVGRK
jgi:hypothetical protein